MDELAKRFAALAEKYGPSVADAAMSAARVEAVSSLVTSIFVLATGAALMFVGRYIWFLDVEDRIDAPIAHAGGFFIGLIGCIVVIVALSQVADPWLWTAFNHPELWLAKKAFHI